MSNYPKSRCRISSRPDRLSAPDPASCACAPNSEPRADTPKPDSRAHTPARSSSLAMPPWLMNRRHMLMGSGAALATAALSGWTKSAQAKPAPGRKFFTRHEFSSLEEISEMIIPKDKVSGGAKAAKVVDLLDIRVGETVDPQIKQSWRDDLEEIDRLTKLWHGRTFRRASFRQRTHVLRRLSRNEANPKKDGEYAFGTIKWEISDIYYRTEIGIHDDLNYQGNVLLDEFIGTDVSGSPAFPNPPGFEKPQSGVPQSADAPATNAPATGPERKGPERKRP